MTNETAAAEPAVGTGQIVDLNATGAVTEPAKAGTDFQEVESLDEGPAESEAPSVAKTAVAEEQDQEAAIAEGDQLFFNRKKAKAKVVEADDDEEEDDESEPSAAAAGDDEEEGDKVDSISAEPDSAVLEVDRKECLTCGHLVAWMPKKKMPCHFTAGNKQCPAESVAIIIHYPTERVVRLFLAAEQKGDLVKLGNMYRKLGSMEPWIQTQVTKALAEAKAKQ